MQQSLQNYLEIMDPALPNLPAEVFDLIIHEMTELAVRRSILRVCKLFYELGTEYLKGASISLHFFS